jgi:hypothetical protein
MECETEFRGRIENALGKQKVSTRCRINVWLPSFEYEINCNYKEDEKVGKTYANSNYL